MRSFQRFRLFLCIVIFIGLGAGIITLSSDSPGEKELQPFEGARFFRVYFDELARAHKIVKSMDTMESNYENGYVVVAVKDRGEYFRLLDTGLALEEISDPLAEKIAFIKESALYQTEAIPGYSCYRTVEETFASAEAIATNYPALATWTDQGNSWEKETGIGGYDLGVLKITNNAIAGPKPKIFISSAIHAREYATAELMIRLAEELVANYGNDPDTTWMLDYHEIHMMLHANPDGRKQAETGLSWRKNTNDAYCSYFPNYRGADLNRNFQFKWNCCGGSSSSECDSTFHGAYAVSEPETQYIQNYVFSQFPDQRGPNDSDPAPLDATGIYIDVHAHGRLVLWPWGWTPAPAPNSTQLQTLGRKIAYFNGYSPEQAYGLYPTDGTTTSFTYGELGLASYTIELGTEFFESCTYFENNILESNKNAIKYAIKVVRTPYMTPAGPDALSPAVSSGSDPAGVPAGTPVTLTATIDDTRYNNSNGTEPSQNILAAEYYLDVPPWETLPTPVAITMTATDGTFNSTTEAVEAIVDTTGWTEGRHILFLRGQDVNNNWGAVSAIFLYINNTVDEDPPSPNPMTWALLPYATGADSIAMTATTAVDPSGVEYYFECLTAGGHHSGWQDSPSYEDTGLTTGTPYTYWVKARDKSPAQNETGWSSQEAATPDCPLPTAPSGLSATAIACDQIDLIWTDNSDNETSFFIERSGDGVNYSPLDSVAANTTGYSDLTVSENTTYYYRIKAANGCGDSGYSNSDSALTPACPALPPTAPGDLVAKAWKYNVILTWTDNSNNETGFRIYRGNSPSTLVEIDAMGPGSTTYDDTGVTRKTTYYYKVCAYNANGEGCTPILQVLTK